MNPKERLELITRNLQEVIGRDELEKKLKSKKEFSIYWGTMPTGSISLAYFFPMLKIADFLSAGCKVKILIADIHAALDSVAWEEVEKRYIYYKEAIQTMLEVIGVNAAKLEFVRGSEFQLQKEYTLDLLKLSTISSLNDTTRAASEGIKSATGQNVKLSGMIYPLMQALDEEYLNVDAQFAGIDQRKIMVYAREFLPKIGYNPRIELMNPMIRGLVGEKMSSSVESSKIDLMDGPETVKKKINKADCAAGDPDNGVMALLRYLIFVIKQDRKESLIIQRSEKYGGNLEYNSYEELEKDFIEKKLHPLDLKNAVADEINGLLESFQKNAKLKKLYEQAYGR